MEKSRSGGPFLSPPCGSTKVTWQVRRKDVTQNRHFQGSYGGISRWHVVVVTSPLIDQQSAITHVKLLLHQSLPSLKFLYAGFLPQWDISCDPPYKDIMSGQVSMCYKMKWKCLPLLSCDWNIFGGPDPCDRWSPCQGEAPKLKCIKCWDAVFDVKKEKSPRTRAWRP